MFTRVLFLLCAFESIVHYANSEITTTANTKGLQQLFVDNTILIACNWTDFNEKVVAWYKDNVTIDDTMENYKINKESNSLEIKKARRNDDEGNYTCSFGAKGNGTIRLLAAPLIHKLSPIGHTKDGRSVNIFEEATLILECVANSSEPVKFEWYTIHNSTENSKGKTKAEGNFTTGDYRSLLTIYSARIEDRAFYECRVHNDVGHAYMQMLVRVKDKWMAVWPFLGIVGEVIILCTIIFIYEKRRQKPDFDDSSDNANENKSPVASGTGQEIRQRK